MTSLSVGYAEYYHHCLVLFHDHDAVDFADSDQSAGAESLDSESAQNSVHAEAGMLAVVSAADSSDK